MINKFYTDYPVVALGDKEGKVAPVRECEVLEYDGDKYCRISVEGHTVEVKRGYVYKSPGRIGEVPCVNVSLLELFFTPNYYGGDCDNECN